MKFARTPTNVVDKNKNGDFRLGSGLADNHQFDKKNELLNCFVGMGVFKKKRKKRKKRKKESRLFRRSLIVFG